jgi:hypothetical protein
VLLTWRFDELKLVVLCVDGMAFGDQVMIGAVGVDNRAIDWEKALR